MAAIQPVDPASVAPAVTGRAARLALLSAGELFGGVERQLLDLCAYARLRSGAFPALVLFHDAELARQARALGVDPIVLRGRHRYDQKKIPRADGCPA